MTTVFKPEDFGAIGNNIADDATPFANMSAAFVANGGGTIEMRPTANYNVFSSGQPTQSVLMNLYNIKGPTIRFNGAKISFGRTWTTNDILYSILAQNCQDMIIEDFNIVQANPVVLPFSTNSGVQGIYPISDCKDMVFINPTCDGCIGLVNSGLISGLTVQNGRALNSVYGCTIVDNGTGIFSENIDISLETSNIQRSLFLRGTKNARIMVTSLNAISNDILISATTTGGTIENIELLYRAKPRTNSIYPQGQNIYIGLGNSGSGTMNSIFRNLKLILDIDQAGYVTNSPAVVIGKSNTGTRNMSLENIDISGSIRNIFSGPIMDLFQASDAPWTGETAKGIYLHNLLLDAASGAGAQFRVDLASVPTGYPMVMRDVFAPNIAATAVNRTSTNLVTDNVHFASGI